MEMTEKQYERIARWLDGQEVTLNEAERIVADEIGRDERMLASAVPADAPREALGRACRRMAAELARPTRRLWIGRFAAAAAAAAAIIVVAALLTTTPPLRDPLPPKPPGPVMADVSIETLIEEMEESLRPGVVVQLLAGELEAIEADMLVTAEIGDMDLQINAIEDEFDDILLDPAAPWSFDGGV